MDKILRVLIMMSLIAVGAQAWANAPFKGYLESSNETVVLEEGWYMVTNNVTITSSEVGKPGIDCAAPNQYIYIAEGGSLIVKGHDGEGTVGGSAAIRLLYDHSLYVAGSGNLIAIGGNAAKGSDGENNNASDFIPKFVWRNNTEFSFRPGYGAAGGNGGGGAGAGIGSDGGAGGISAGANKPGDTGWYAATTDTHETANHDEIPGLKGGSGTAALSMGLFSVSGQVRLNVTGGNEADSGGFGARTAPFALLEWLIEETDSYCKYKAVSINAGGSGGGGGGGGMAYAIGSGGKGGDAGQSGAVGSTIVFEYDNQEQSYFGDKIKPAAHGTTASIASGSVTRGCVNYDPAFPVPNFDYLNAGSRPIVYPVQSTDWIEFELTFDDSNDVLDLASKTKIKIKLSEKINNFPKGKSNSAEKIFVGWSDKNDGTGTLYFDQAGSLLTKYLPPGDMTLYPVVLSPADIAVGLTINGEEVDQENGKTSGDGWVWENLTIKLNKEDMEYSITGTNEYGVVAIKVEKSCKVKVDGRLELKYDFSRFAGGIMIEPGATLDLEMKDGYSLIDASKVSNMCAIHCPAGAALNLTTSPERGMTFEQGQGGYITLSFDRCQVRNVIPTFKAGNDAAAIGSRRDEASGDITIDDCVIDVLQNRRTTPAIGHGYLSDSSVKLKSGEIVLKNMPKLYSGHLSLPECLVVSPRPHNEYGRPLLLAGSAEDSYFFPAGPVEMHYQTSSGTKMVWKALIKHNKATEIEHKSE